MSVEQVKLMEQIIYYGFNLTLNIQNVIAQINDKKILSYIKDFLNQNHSEINQKELEKYLYKMLNRSKLKKVFKYILTKDFSDDTNASIMYLLGKTKTPEKTLDDILKILNMNLDDELTYQKLCNMIDN